MSKTLVAHEQSLAKIFSDDYVFSIPGYQRPYSWTTEQARELFDDLIDFIQDHDGPIEDLAPYFLGSIVLIKSDTSPKADVVDGQQRLTTLTILLAALRACIGSEHAKDITQFIYERGSTIAGTKDRFRLTLRDRDAAFFQRYVQREGGFQNLLSVSDTLSSSQNNIRANANLLFERLETLKDTMKIRLAQFIVSRCFLVVVATPDLDSAYRIFSILNSRGLDLSATDILKAQIIGGIPDSLKSAYTNKWEDAEDDLGRESFGDLFSHIRMIYRKSKPKGTLLKEFKDHVTEMKWPTRFIDDILLPMSHAYEEILDAEYESIAYAEDVNEHLKWLNRLEFSDWVPPALAFMSRYHQKPKQMKIFFCALERLSYFMLVTRVGINGRIDRFSSLTRQIESETEFLADGTVLKLTPNEQHEFYAALDGPIYYNLGARARSTIMLRLDRLLSGGGATYDYDIVTVEHVLPQNPPQNSQWLKWFPNQRKRESIVNRVGNLALLTRKKNSSASNYDFETKKKAYFARNGISPFAITTQVLSQSDWTTDVVEQRQTELMSVLESHWRLSDRSDEFEL